jgi:hypothetical protein
MFTSSDERQIIVVKSRQNSLGLAWTIYSLGWLTRPSGWKKQHSWRQRKCTLSVEPFDLAMCNGMPPLSPSPSVPTDVTRAAVVLINNNDPSTTCLAEIEGSGLLDGCNDPRS